MFGILTGLFTSVGNMASRGIACLAIPLPASSPVDPEIVGPDRQLLAPNVPNPFNPATTFTFTLPAVGDVRLAVYDMRGRLVGEIAGGHFEAGEHTALWNGRGLDGRELPSGVYLARLSGDFGEQSVKITLTR